MVRKRTVEFKVKRYDFDRQCRQARSHAQHGRHGVSAHAIASIHDDFQRLDAIEVDQAAKVSGIGRQRFPLADRAQLFNHWDARLEQLGRAIANGA